MRGLTMLAGRRLLPPTPRPPMNTLAPQTPASVIGHDAHLIRSRSNLQRQHRAWLATACCVFAGWLVIVNRVDAQVVDAQVVDAQVVDAQVVAPWQRHTIDASLIGADGVRLADFNGDGLLDVVTGWEESGRVRLYLHPGYERVREMWPAVTVGIEPSPEDAVACDMDGDGRLDIVSCHEGSSQRVLVHWNRSDGSSPSLLDPGSWQTEVVTGLSGQRWMFAEPLGKIGGRQAIAVGSKDRKASITLLLAPRNRDATDLSAWTIHRLRDAGWIMTLRAIDMNDDGNRDLVFSDRRGSARGIGWLEQPAKDADSAAWPEHRLGGQQHEVMFIDPGPRRILASTRNAEWLDLQRSDQGTWSIERRRNPQGVPLGKAIARLGDRGMVMTANTQAAKRVPPTVGMWHSFDGDQWTAISKTQQVKFDRIECIDLDNDGDLDVMTCEERQGLGVVWYENPGIERAK